MYLLANLNLNFVDWCHNGKEEMCIVWQTNIILRVRYQLRRPDKQKHGWTELKTYIRHDRWGIQNYNYLMMTIYLFAGFNLTGDVLQHQVKPRPVASWVVLKLYTTYVRPAERGLVTFYYSRSLKYQHIVIIIHTHNCTQPVLGQSKGAFYFSRVLKYIGILNIVNQF